MQDRGISRPEFLTSSRSTPLITRRERPSIWSSIYPIFTILIPSFVIRRFLRPRNHDPTNLQQERELNNKIESWREKMALVNIIFILCLIMTLLTVGMQTLFCSSNNQLIKGEIEDNYDEKGNLKEQVKKRNERAGTNLPSKYTFFNGSVYKTPSNELHNKMTTNLITTKHINCSKRIKGKYNNASRVGDLHLNGRDISKMKTIRIKNRIYNLDFIKEFNDDSEIVSEEFIKENIDLINIRGDSIEIKDNEKLSKTEIKCLSCTLEKIYVGKVTSKSYGCLLSSLVLYLGTIIIFSLLIIKFLLATVYNFYIKKKIRRNKRRYENTFKTDIRKNKRENYNYNLKELKDIEKIKLKKYKPEKLKNKPTITLITAYSENTKEIKSTLDSLNEQTHDNQIVWLIFDGLIMSNEKILSPVLGINLLTEIYSISDSSSYFSIGENFKSINNCIVISGLYKNIKTILIIKIGNIKEINEDMPKQGNRGKRDGQVILMSFLQKYFYKDRFSPLDYEIYKVFMLFNIKIEDIEFLSMVDADTVLDKNAIQNFGLAYFSDPDIIGMCGETRIYNKNENFQTMCQVFEYFISHFLNKSFESIFGGVTCLPGCFCSYRIFKRMNRTDLELQQERDSLVPIVCNTQIVNTYSQRKLPSLHHKNLYSLGEDRFLTTLILKTFYKQKLVFIPQAFCFTEVPNSFRILFSQRRRWINSTVHNLFVLSRVDKLCGAFCCSMQFVTIFDIFGTLVLPAAILFTFLLIFKSIFFEPEWIPLLMLLLIFGFPGCMVFLTNFDLRLFFYLVVYIISLPMWNFALPLYAFWHFDDFSWGETCKEIKVDKKEKKKIIKGKMIVEMKSYDEVVNNNRNSE